MLKRLLLDSPGSSTIERWLEDSVGIKRALLESLDADDDWTFVIKMHGILEAGLNHLLVTQLDSPSPKLRRIVARLETSNPQTGKLAFIKAYDLLSDDACKFVQLLSEIRNSAVHDVKNFDFTLSKHLATLDDKQIKNWQKALTSWCSAPWYSEEAETEVRDIALRFPRDGIFNSCISIVYQALAHQMKIEARNGLLKALHDLGEPDTNAKSIPKE